MIVGGATAAASALLDRPDLAVASTNAYPGGPLFVKGSGCEPGAAVDIRLDGAVLGTTSTEAGGYFSADLVLPSKISMGEHTITASCEDGAGMSVQHLVITVTEQAPAQPLPADFTIGGSTIPHGQFVAKGAGCRPGTTVTFSVAGAGSTGHIGTAGVNDDGIYTALLPAPDLAVGEHAVEASCLGSDGNQLVLTSSLQIIDPADAGETRTKPTP